MSVTLNGLILVCLFYLVVTLRRQKQQKQRRSADCQARISMLPINAPVLLYLWDKRTFHLGQFQQPLQLSQAAAMLLFGLDGALYLESQGCQVACRSALLPAGLELSVDSRSSRVAICYLDVFGEDFAHLAPRMAANQAGVLFGLDSEPACIQRFDELHRSSAPPEQVCAWLDELINPQQMLPRGFSPDPRIVRAIELIKAVRAAVGPDFPIILRFSQWKQQDYSARLVLTPEALGEFLQPLSDAGVDIFHCSTRRFWEPEFDGSDLNLAGWTRKLTGKPTITVGSVGLDGEFLQFMVNTDKVAKPADLGALLTRLNNQEFDLVAVGRALLVDPDWAVKVRDGRQEDILPFSRQALMSLV